MENTTTWRANLLERQRWIIFLAPFLVFMLAGALEPTPDKSGGGALGLAIPYTYYPWVYVCKIALTLVAIVFVWPGYRAFPFRVSPLGLLIGVIGGPIWIGLCLLDVEHRFLLPLLQSIGLGWLIESVRSGFNPFDPANGLSSAAAWAFLGVRFFGLVVVIAIIEEFFLRGFVMRFVMEREWWNVPFGDVNRLAVVVGTALPMLCHPEWLAAFVWFSMITWLMVRTRNIWDCIAAHALTNLILGVYVVVSNDWRWM